MLTDTPECIASMDAATLTPLVQRALDAPSALVLSWKRHQIYGGMGTGTAVYRVSGQAQQQGESVPWSLILKVLYEDSNREDPSHPEWWRREAEWPWLSRNWIRRTVEQAAPALPRLAIHGDHPSLRPAFCFCLDAGTHSMSIPFSRYN